MEKRDLEEFVQGAENFQSRLQAIAMRHDDAGEDAAAGMLLLLERRIYRAANRYRREVAELLPREEQATPPGMVAPGAPPKCKHEFAPLVIGGVQQIDAPWVCLKCGVAKKANGRPKKAAGVPGTHGAGDVGPAVEAK